MTSQRILGVLLLIGGVALFIFGVHASNSIADQVSNSFFGRFKEGTTWYVIGGIGTALLGLFLLLVSLLGKKA